MTDQNDTSSKAYGRHLSDLWLDGEEGKLHPAEWKLLACVAKGEECVLGDVRPVIATEENRVRAEIVRFLALGGDDNNPLHEHGVWVAGAFIACDPNGLDLSGGLLPRRLGLKDCKIDGDIHLDHTTTKTLLFRGCSVQAVNASGLYCDGFLFLRENFQVQKIAILIGAKINGDLDCTSGNFLEETTSLHLDSIQITGNCVLGDLAKFLGEVRLVGAIIDGQLNCRNGHFLDNKISLNLDNASVKGAVFLDHGFLAKGTVDLTSTKIGTELHLSNAIFSCKDKSIHAPHAKIGGNVELGKECRVAGQISFQGATIGGDMTFAGGSFEGKPAINLRNAQIDGTLVWRGVEHARGELNLSGASCRTLNMDWKSWEKPSRVRLDNFIYKGFSELPEGCNAQFWRDWLERQPDKYLTTRFRPNAYSQLADVLDNMGHEQEAKSIRVEQRWRQSQFTRLYEPLPNHDSGRLMRNMVVFWNFVQGALVDYGYRPGKAIMYLFGVIALGSVIFHMAARNGIMAPTHPLIFKEVGKTIPTACADNWVYFPDDIKTKCEEKIPSEYSEFNALMYSVDLALPIVNFRIETDWSPRVVTPNGKRYWPGWWTRTWEWIQITAGWLLSLLFVSAIGGIIRR